jgi:hypothetical protein
MSTQGTTQTATPKKTKATKKSAKATKTAKAKKVAKPAKAKGARSGSKAEKVLELMKRKEGATLAEIAKATEWQNHSIRGFVSGHVTKKLGLKVESTKSESAERTYRIVSKDRACRNRSRLKGRLSSLGHLSLHGAPWGANLPGRSAMTTSAQRFPD